MRENSRLVLPEGVAVPAGGDVHRGGRRARGSRARGDAGDPRARARIARHRARVRVSGDHGLEQLGPDSRRW